MYLVASVGKSPKPFLWTTAVQLKATQRNIGLILRRCPCVLWVFRSSSNWQKVRSTMRILLYFWALYPVFQLHLSKLMYYAQRECLLNTRKRWKLQDQLKNNREPSTPLIFLVPSRRLRVGQCNCRLTNLSVDLAGTGCWASKKRRHSRWRAPE